MYEYRLGFCQILTLKVFLLNKIVNYDNNIATLAICTTQQICD